MSGGQTSIRWENVIKIYNEPNETAHFNSKVTHFHSNAGKSWVILPDNRDTGVSSFYQRPTRSVDFHNEFVSCINLWMEAIPQFAEMSSSWCKFVAICSIGNNVSHNKVDCLTTFILCNQMRFHRRLSLNVFFLAVILTHLNSFSIISINRYSLILSGYTHNTFGT